MTTSRLMCAAVIAVFSTGAMAQAMPDAGSLLRENERQQRQLPTPGVQAVPEPAVTPEQRGLRFTVKGFQVAGNTLVTEAELQEVLSPWVGQEASFAELQAAANAVTEHYRRKGWLVRTQLPAQEIDAGIVQLNIIEGRLGAVRIDDGGAELRIDEAFISESITARQKTGDPLNLDALERSSNILNDTPGVAVATLLTPSDQPGASDAVVKVQDKPLWSGMVQYDNQAARSTGEEKGSLSVNLDNPSGQGDQVGLNANNSQGNRYARLAYTRPLGHDGLRVGLSASDMKYHLIGEFAKSGNKGDAKTIGLTAQYPLFRTARQNLSLSASLDRKDYNIEFNLNDAPRKRMDVLSLSVNGDMLDSLGAGGMTLGGINLVAGHVDLSGNPSNEVTDATHARTAGSYEKIGINLARLQRLDDQTTLWASLTAQFAGKNLDSSEQMSLGGPSGVRAYPVIEGSGDDGWLATVEFRHALTPEWQLTTFYDHGVIRLRHDNDFDTSGAVNSAVLKGWGIGLNYNLAGNFAVRAAWARRIGENRLPEARRTGNDSDGSHDLDRLWLTLVKFF